MLATLVAYLVVSSFLTAVLFSVLYLAAHPPAAGPDGRPVAPNPTLDDLKAIVEDPVARAAAVGVQILAALGITLLAARLLDRRSLGSLGFSLARPRWAAMGWGALLGVVLSSVVVLTITAVGGRHLRAVGFEGTSPVVIAGVAALLLGASFAEEWLLRGYAYRNLREDGSAGRAILLSALLFSAMHIDHPVGGFSGWFNLFLMGIVLAQLREITGAVSMSFGLHAAWSLTVRVLFGAGPEGFPIPAAFAVSLHDLPVLLGGGRDGPEGSLTATAALLAAALVLGRRFMPEPRP